MFQKTRKLNQIPSRHVCPDDWHWIVATQPVSAGQALLPLEATGLRCVNEVGALHQARLWEYRAVDIMESVLQLTPSALDAMYQTALRWQFPLDINPRGKSFYKSDRMKIVEPNIQVRPRYRILVSSMKGLHDPFVPPQKPWLGLRARAESSKCGLMGSIPVRQAQSWPYCSHADTQEDAITFMWSIAENPA